MNKVTEEFPYYVGVTDNTTSDYWMWCSSNLDPGMFKEMFAILGNHSTFYFKQECDLLAFRMKFGLF